MGVSRWVASGVLLALGSMVVACQVETVGVAGIGAATDARTNGDEGEGEAARRGVGPPESVSPVPVESCGSPPVTQVCDPVCNTGCPALTRCDLGDQPGRGACVGVWIGGESDRCWRTASTDSCGARLTCYSGRCRRLCHLDRDCTGTERCCNVDLPVGGDDGAQGDAASSGFKACGPCS